MDPGLVRHSSAGILLFLGILVILPLAFLVAGMYLPQALQSVTEMISINTPLVHAINAMSASHLLHPEQGWQAIIKGMVGTAAWALGFALLAWPVFKKQDA